MIAVLIEHRLGPAEVVGHRHILAADVGGVLGHIGVGHDQRLFDHGARARRKETVEPAIERRRGHDGDEDGRNRGDHREQADDLNVQPRAGAAAAARLDDDPDFAPDDGEQEQAGDGIAKQQLDDHLVDRRDRGQTGEHQKCGGGRKQREPTAIAPISREATGIGAPAAGSSGATGTGAAAADVAGRPDRQSSFSFPEPSNRWKLKKKSADGWNLATRPQVMLLYNNVARLRQLLGGPEVEAAFAPANRAGRAPATAQACRTGRPAA